MPYVGTIGLKGLTANDRTQQEKNYLDTIQGNSSPVIGADSLNIRKQSTPSYNPKQIIYNVTAAKNAYIQETYEDLLEKYNKQYRVGSGTITDNSDIKEIADKVSSHYKKYKFNPDKLTLTNEDWKSINAEYHAISDMYGENTAKRFLDNKITENVKSNQGALEKVSNSFGGFLANFFGYLTQAVGAVNGVGNYILGDYNRVEGLNEWGQFINSVIDNPVTRYGKDVSEYGSLFPSVIEKNKSYASELNPHGLSQWEIVQTEKDRQKVFDLATSPFIAFQSGGSTAASMIEGGVLGKAASLTFGALARGAAWAGKAAQTSKFAANTFGRAVNTADKLDDALKALKVTENAVNRYMVPGITGSFEGITEGLQTKMQVQEEGQRQLDEFYANRAHEMIQERLADPTNKKSEEEIFHDVWNELGDKYMESKNQIEYAAARAGINNFYANSLINGVLNMTLKAGLQADNVQNALKNGKLTGWAFSKPKYNVVGIPGTESAVATTASKATWLGKAWAIAKEPIGEGTEEYLQTISNDVMSGAAENNIHEFIENKFSDEGTAVVGDWFGSDWGAAWNALGKSAFSVEAAQAAIMGALSSAMGTPVLPGRRQRFNKKTGQYESTSIFNPANLVKDKNESTWDYIQRITPWRSGAYSNYREYMNDVKRAKTEAEHLTEWLRDPDNIAKFDGAVGTTKWAMDMTNSAKSNDEFGYRNSAMGKAVHDALMLSKIKDTKFGQSWIQHLKEVSELDPESEEAKKYVEHMKNDVNIDTEGKSDEEILDTLKKNALKMRTTLATIEKESKSIDRLIGNVDDDTRQSLIYSRIMLDDWKKRGTQLNNEINDIKGKIKSSRGFSSSEYSDTEKKMAARHGSLKAAINYMSRQNEIKEELEKKIKEIEALGDDATDTEKKSLNVMKAQVKSIGQTLKEYDALSKDAADRVVLNEEEIMDLDPVTRGRMLRLGSQRLYATLHEDKEAIDSINDEIDELESQKKTIKKKSVKGGKAHRAQAKKLKEINSELNDLRRQLKQYKGETRQFYSDEQQAVIDKLVEQGIAEDPKFLDKVVDAGRMQASIDNFYTQRKEILTDPRAYNNYVKRQKFRAQQERIKRRAEHIGKIENYNEFADELDRVNNSVSPYEKDIIISTLRDSNNENWIKYKQKRDYAESLAAEVFDSELSDNMTRNDISMFWHTLDYLQNKDVDLHDMDQVISTLQEKDENSDYLFRKYVERINDSRPEAERTVFTSIGSAIETYKKALRLKTKQDEETEKLNREVPTESAPRPEGAPIETPPAPRVQSDTPKEEDKPKKQNIWDLAYDSPEGGQLDADENPVSSRPNESSWNNDIQECFSIARKTIDNSSYKEDVKKSAREKIDSLDNPDVYDLESYAQFIDELNRVITAVRSAIDDSNNNENVAKLLEYVSKTLRDSMESKNDKSNSNNNTDQSDDLSDIRNNITLTTIDIDNVRKNYPDSWIVGVYDAYDIDDYIRRHRLNINTPIYFMTNSEWDNKGTFDSSNRPIMAVVEDKNGPIEINGVKYQPIGFMPATGKKNVTGSNRLADIRKLAINEPGQHIVLNNNGTRVETRAKGKAGAIKATHPDIGTNRLNAKENNRSVKNLVLNTLPASEQQRINALSPRDRLKDPVYIRAKKDFISRLYVDKDQLKFKHDNLKDDKGGSSLIFDTSIGSKDINGYTNIDGDTIQQVVAQDNPAKTTEFNTRTSRLYNDVISYIFDKIISKLDINENSTEDFAAAEKSISEIFNKKVKNFIYITNTNFNFKAKVDIEKSQELGKPVFNITLEDNVSDNPSVIELGSMIGDSDKRAYGKEFISKLLLDENNEVRPFVKWQIPYSDIKILTGEVDGNPRYASENISMIIDDDIMEIAASSLQYDLHGIEMETPFNKWGDPRDFPPVVANPENASNNDLGTPPNTGSTARTGNGTAVDVQTGMSIDGTTPSTQKNPGLENAKKLEKTIRENSRNLKLSSDGKYYELWEYTGWENGKVVGKVVKRFTRVTTLIEADEKGEKFPENSPYVVPSTAIGNTVDEITRDFFSGEFYKLSSWCSRKSRSEATEANLEDIYPNMTTKQINNLLDSLEKLRMSFAEKGIHIIPNEVTVTGTIDIIDEEKKKHTIPVAGTLDLLGYDNQGNFYIFDMKTIHDYNKDKAEERKPKWQRQLSVYSDLLRQEYGIDVDESRMKIIPFSVKYDVKNNTYREDEKRENSLIEVNKKTGGESDFKGAFPILKSESYSDTIPLSYVELNLVWNKLDKSIKELLGVQIPEGVKPETIQSGEKKPKRPSFEPDELSELENYYNDNSALNTGTTEAPSIYASDDLNYSNFSKEVKSRLRKGMGIRNEKAWNELTSELQRKYLDCVKS